MAGVLSHRAPEVLRYKLSKGLLKRAENSELFSLLFTYSILERDHGMPLLMQRCERSVAKGVAP